jgi:hypothetical protein
MIEGPGFCILHGRLTFLAVDVLWGLDECQQYPPSVNYATHYVSGLGIG